MRALDDLLGLWPTHAAFAADTGIHFRHVSSFVQRQSIHTRHWPAIIAAAAKQAKNARRRGDEAEALKFDAVNADSLLKLQISMEAARKST